MIIDQQLESALRDLLERDEATKLITPAQAAREVGGNRWRNLEVSARKAALRLSQNGECEIVPSIPGNVSATSPIRIRKSSR